MYILKVFVTSHFFDAVVMICNNHKEYCFEALNMLMFLGTSLDAQEHPSFGKKFIGGSNGSIIEMHGQAKKSWTKLTGTVTPNNGSCGFVYDSWVITNFYNRSAVAHIISKKMNMLLQKKNLSKV